MSTVEHCMYNSHVISPVLLSFRVTNIDNLHHRNDRKSVPAGIRVYLFAEFIAGQHVSMFVTNTKKKNMQCLNRKRQRENKR